MSLTSLGEPIAGTENLYAWGEGQILKLYREGTPEDFLEWLGELERALREAGLPVPAVGELVAIDGQLGQVYERITGETLAHAALAGGAGSVEIVEIAHLFAEVHARIHACTDVPVKLLPQPHALSERIRRAPGLVQPLREATLQAFDRLPVGRRLCHGDFHPLNVLLGPRGPVVIDWPNAHMGHPLEDVARTVLMLEGARLSDPALATLQGAAAVEQFTEAYLARYFQLTSHGREQLVLWRPVVAAVRLNERIPELGGWLLEQIRAGLNVPQ